MTLDMQNQENLSFMIQEMAKKLQVVNRSIMDPKDYPLKNYEEIKNLYDMIHAKENFSVSEIQAIVEELGKYRRK
ncbi:DUF1128 domain-containing protein [Bacillaceae bacterium S4-13-58]